MVVINGTWNPASPLTLLSSVLSPRQSLRVHIQPSEVTCLILKNSLSWDPRETPLGRPLYTFKLCSLLLPTSVLNSPHTHKSPLGREVIPPQGNYFNTSCHLFRECSVMEWNDLKIMIKGSFIVSDSSLWRLFRFSFSEKSPQPTWLPLRRTI